MCSDDEEVVLVPVTAKQSARIYRRDLQALIREGAGPPWFIHPATGQIHACQPSGVRIARRVVNAGKHHSVLFRDGDRLNLVWSNLITGPAGKVWPRPEQQPAQWRHVPTASDTRHRTRVKVLPTVEEAEAIVRESIASGKPHTRESARKVIAALSVIAKQTQEQKQ